MANILRISGNGAYQMVYRNLPGTATFHTGDGKAWYQMDLKPGSATLMTVVASGTGAPAFSLYDRAYVPGTASYLWSLGQNGTARTCLMRFDRSTKAWTSVRDMGVLSTTGNGQAVWSALYASENCSGEIWRMQVGNLTAPAQKVANGPTSTSIDGARCIDSVNV